MVFQDVKGCCREKHHQLFSRSTGGRTRNNQLNLQQKKKMQVRYQLKCQTIKRVKRWERLPGSIVKNLALEVFEAGLEEQEGMLRVQGAASGTGHSLRPSGLARPHTTSRSPPQKSNNLTSPQNSLVRLGFSDHGVLFEIALFAVISIRGSTSLSALSPHLFDISPLRSVPILIPTYWYESYYYLRGPRR